MSIVYCSWRGLREQGCLLYYTMDIERARVIIMCIMYVYLSVQLESRSVYCTMDIERAGVIIRLWESPVLRQ